MRFLYKTEDGRLVFQGFTVTVHGEDPDAEEFIQGNYKNYDIEYSVPPVHFKASVRSRLFTKKYTIEEATYYDGEHYFALLTPITGKPAKLFLENFEEILKNPKNVYLIPYLDKIGTKFSVDAVPYRAYYSDEQYILGHGLFEVLFITANRSYLETYSVDIEISLGEKDVVSIFNAVFPCKEHKCVMANLRMKARIISNKRILTRELYQIIMNPRVLGLVNEGETFYFLVKDPHGEVVRYYTNPDNEIVFRIEPENDPKKAVNVDMKYYDLLEILSGDKK